MVKRHYLSGKDIKELARKVDREELAKYLLDAETVEEYEVDEKLTMYIVNGYPILAKVKVNFENQQIEKLIPLLPTFYLPSTPRPSYPFVRVDDGAVPRIVNGADVMRPGIKEFSGNFNKGDIVLVKDFKDRVIAVGLALVSREEAEQMQKGKVVKNVHYLGDKIWKLCEEEIKKKRG